MNEKKKLRKSVQLHSQPALERNLAPRRQAAGGFAVGSASGFAVGSASGFAVGSASGFAVG